MLKKNKDGLLLAPRKYKSKELKNFYKNIYYQQNKPKTFKKKYSKEELCHNLLSFKLAEVFFKKKYKKILDVGCGEGYLLKYFNKLKYNCSGVDFSSYAINNHNKNLLKYINFESCDIVNDKYFEGQKFDVIFLMGVAEHVENFSLLTKKLFKKLNKEGLLIIKVPNEYDLVHKEYIKENNLKKEDLPIYNPLHHLNYFNKNSLKNSVLNNVKMKLVTMYSDFPIEMFILNKNTNYYKKKNFGKNANDLRIKISNLLQKNKKPFNIIKYYEQSLNIGLGRTITAIFQK